MLSILVPLAIAVAGLLFWALSTNTKVAEAGRIAFFCGLLVLTAVLANTTWHIGPTPH